MQGPISTTIPDPATQAHRLYWQAYRQYRATPETDHAHRRQLAATCHDQAARIAASGSVDYPTHEYAYLARHWANVAQ